MISVEYLCSLMPRGIIAGIMAVEGPLLKVLADHRPGRFMIRRFTHGGLGRVCVRIARAGRLIEGRGPVELSMSVLRYFFEPFLEEVKVSEEEAVFYLKRCPYGWCTSEDAPLCDAVMELERELVAGIRGTLIIEETIPQGAPKCRFRLAERPRP